MIASRQNQTGLHTLFGTTNNFGVDMSIDKQAASRLSKPKKLKGGLAALESIARSGVHCDHCGKPAEYVDNRKIYGKSYGRWPMSWLCRPCGAYVGCHPNTNRPLGTLATREMREWRKKAKNPFLELVQSRWDGRRSPAYKWLAEKLGINPSDCHFGMFDVDTCKRVFEIVENERGV